MLENYGELPGGVCLKGEKLSSKDYEEGFAEQKLLNLAYLHPSSEFIFKLNPLPIVDSRAEDVLIPLRLFSSPLTLAVGNFIVSCFCVSGTSLTIM